MKQHCLLGMVPAVIARVLPRRFWLIRIMSRMARGLSKTIFPFMIRGSVAANISLERVQFTMAVLFVWPNPYLARSRCGWLLFGLTSPDVSSSLGLCRAPSRLARQGDLSHVVPGFKLQQGNSPHSTRLLTYTNMAKARFTRSSLCLPFYRCSKDAEIEDPSIRSI